MFNWAAFFIYSFVSTFTPGPNNIMSMNFASQMGIQKSYPFNLGMFIGRIITMILSALLTGLLYQFIPNIQFPMKIIGALYMLYLAWNCLYNTISANKKEIKAKFINGMLLQFINAKAIIAGINVMTVIIFPFYQKQIQLIGFALLFAFIGFLAGLSWGVFGTLFRKVFISHRKVINITMSLLLVYCAISLFI